LARRTAGVRVQIFWVCCGAGGPPATGSAMWNSVPLPTSVS